MVALTIAGGILFFVGLWTVVTGLLASLSGWTALAESFPGGERPAGEVIRGQVIGMGRVQEKNVTFVIATTAGLYLYAMPLFRFRRQPVLVPWRRVRYAESHRFLWARWHDVDLGGVTTLKVRPRLLAVLASHGVAIPSDVNA
ncbi:MAG: hypothetical protein U0132_20825 [Gemmatimonadaceae bacterium]